MKCPRETEPGACLNLDEFRELGMPCYAMLQDSLVVTRLIDPLFYVYFYVTVSLSVILQMIFS